MPRALLVFVLCTSGFLGAVLAEGGASESTEKKVSDASTLLETLLSEDADSRQSAIEELSAIPSTPTDAYGVFFNRERQSTEEERRAVLESIEVDVPDAEGKFATPERQTAKAVREADEFDWLAALTELDASTPGLRDVVADVSAIRSLSMSVDWHAATLILNFVFSEEGLIYRDEGGRRLRAMSPYSIPSLIYGSQNRNDASIKRYATYQLERLDRQNANKAFADTPSEGLKIAVLHAFADSGYREAVYTVLDQVNHVAPKVRAAAREAWMEYVSGKPPRPAPKRKLELTGGKTSEEEEPLWLDHRELASVAIRRKMKELTGENPGRDQTLIQVSNALFKYYDNLRQGELDALFDRGKKNAEARSYQEAATLFDQILALSPSYAKRDEMARAFYEAAGEAEASDNLQQASTYFAKAYALAPDSEISSDALAKHHLARGKLAQASGDDGAAEFARAQVVEVSPMPTKSHSSKTMLWGALGAFAAALVAFIIAFSVRRRRA